MEKHSYPKYWRLIYYFMIEKTRINLIIFKLNRMKVKLRSQINFPGVMNEIHHISQFDYYIIKSYNDSSHINQIQYK